MSSQPEQLTTYHLGDLVGYAPWPDEVVELIRHSVSGGVAGNYDSTVATSYKHCGCQYEDPEQEALSHESYAWTLKHVSDATRRYLAELPFRVDLKPLGGHHAGPRIVLVHGTPTLNTLYWTEDRTDDFCLKMAGLAGLQSGDAICFGHTHKPWHRVIQGIHFVNTGSVGRPKDGDSRAGYVILDVIDGAIGVDFRRVEYDLDRAVAGILASDLPNAFGDYLRSGGKGAQASA